MAAGKLSIQANDGKVAGIGFEDGASSDVSVVIPKEGGTLATEAYAVSKSGDTMTGNLNISTSSTTASIEEMVSAGTTRARFVTYPESHATRANTAWLTTQSLSSLVFGINNVDKLRIDTGGNVLVTGSGGLGYGTGSGGKVTQLTSKETAVTLNKPCGSITVNGSSLANGGVVQFAVINSAVSGNDVVHVMISSGVSSNLNYIIQAQGVYGGGFNIVIRNVSGISLSENIVINFAIIKGATA